MNARAIRQRLMRNRSSTFFGSRAFLTVRFPLSVLPSKPDWTPPGKSTGLAGYWTRTGADGVEETVVISEVHTGKVNPRESKRITWPIYYPEQSWMGNWVFWEAQVIRQVLPKPEVSHMDPALAEPMVTAYRAHQRWHARYLTGNSAESTGIQALDALDAASSGAKATYGVIHGAYAYKTYSVKWFYPERARRFSNDLARALDVCKKEGFTVRVL